ncbi:MAG: hypothetical protein KFF77_00975 [Bacteroidetes bacterium]|nr:hypothetical protein [Bacteroidota bacterium]
MRRNPAVPAFLLSISLLFILMAGCGSSTSGDIDIPITTELQDARSFFLQGREAFDLERRDEARTHFDQAIEADSTFALAYLYRSLCAESPGEQNFYADLAVQHVAGASDGEALLIDLREAEIQRDLDRRALLARRLKARYPRSPRALYLYAQVQAEKQDVYAERTALETALDINGLFAPALRAMANSYAFENPQNLREAERFARRYVNLYPDQADAHIVLGDVYRADMQLENARGEYTQAAIVDRDSYIAYVKRGHAQTFIGLYNDARRDYAQATELGIGPAKAQSAHYRTLTWIYAGDLPRAIEENEAVLHTLPLLGLDAGKDFQSYYNTWYNRFLMCTEAKRFPEAEEALRQCSQFARRIAEQVESQSYTRTTESEIALLEGRLALARGEFIAASGHTDRAVDFLRPVRSARKRENTELLLGRIQLALGNPARALDHLIEANQDLIQVKFYHALALEGIGRNTEAESLFREVAHWNFSDIEYAFIRERAMARVYGP